MLKLLVLSSQANISKSGSQGHRFVERLAQGYALLEEAV